MGFSFTISSVAAIINQYGSGGTLKPGEQWYEALDYSEITNQPVTSQKFFVQTNASINLYLLDAAQFTTYMVNKTVLATPVIQGINGIFTEEWNVTFLNVTCHLPVINVSAQNSRHVWMVVLLNNTAGPGVSVQFNVRLGYTSGEQLLADLASFAKFLDMACFAIVSIKLLWATRKLRKNQEDSNRAEIVRGMGLAYLCVFGAYFIGEMNQYLGEEYGGGFQPSLFRINYNLSGLPLNYFDLSICFLLMLVSSTFLSLTYTVEKKLKNFRYPILGIIQLAATCVIPFVFALPGNMPFMFLFALFFLVIAIVLGAALIVTVYVQIAIKSSGLLRKRAIFTLLGLILPLSCFAIREFGHNTIGNWFFIILDLVTICGLLFFWWGNMKYLEKPPQEPPSITVQE